MSKSISIEMASIQFFYERNNLESLLDLTNCERHAKAWGRELLLPLWTAQNSNEQQFFTEVDKE